MIPQIGTSQSVEGHVQGFFERHLSFVPTARAADLAEVHGSVKKLRIPVDGGPP